MTTTIRKFESTKLRIRASAQVAIVICVTNNGTPDGSWVSNINATWNGRPVRILARSFANGPHHETEEESLEAVLQEAWLWVRGLKMPTGKRNRVLLDVETHAAQLLGRHFAPNYEGYVPAKT